MSFGAFMLVTGAGRAAEATSPPDFAPNPSVGWAATPGPFIPPPSGPGPVPALDLRHASPNAGFFERGTQPTFEMGDPDAPILQPWAKEQVRARNEAILAGKPGFTRQASCWPNGTPAFLLYPQQPVYFVQAPKEVVMIWQGDHQFRYVYLNTPHSRNPKPSWYGESVGHYEGDTLVVDTIGLNDRTFVDNYRTPHTTQLHVVERFKLVDGGRTLQAVIAVDDPGAFNMPWSAVQRWRRREDRPMIELVCAENPNNYFNFDMAPLPTAAKPDF